MALFCRVCGRPLKTNPEWPVYRHDPAFSAFAPAPLDFDSVPPNSQFARLWPEASLGEEVLAPPVVEHGLLILCSRKGAFYVLNRFTGERLTDVRVGEGDCFALIGGRTLVAAAGNRVVAYDLLSAFQSWTAGRFRLPERWRKTLKAGPIQYPLNRLAGLDAETGSILACTGAADGSLIHCLNLETGEDRWPAPAAIPAAASAPAADEDGNAYVVAADHRVYRIAGDSGALTASEPLTNPVRTDVAPAWLDSTLYFFDEEGALCACRTDSGDGLTPSRVSELTMVGVKGFATSPRGVLVSHGLGMTRLSLGGQLIWRADRSMGGMSSSPVLAGDCAFGVSQNRSVLYLCDFKGTFLRFHQFLLTEDNNLAPPAFAGRVIYTCSRHGDVSALKVNTT
jgi:outer membrane protein assembly factor BamB